MGRVWGARASLLAVTAAVTAAVAVLVPAGAALAQRCEAPPGTAGIEQYCETLPSPRGSQQPGTGAPLGPALEGRTRRMLERLGRDGRGVVSLPATGSRESRRVRLAEPGESPLGAVGSAVESGPSTGSGFVWLLAAAALCMAGIGWMRYRARGRP